MPATTTRPSSGDIHDLVAVGFGPASLALAIALVEHNSHAPRPQQPTYSSLGGLQEAIGFSVDEAVRDRSGRAGVAQRTLKCAFVERFPRFLWHPGMMLEGSTMQISYVSFLAFATLFPSDTVSVSFFPRFAASWPSERSCDRG